MMARVEAGGNRVQAVKGLHEPKDVKKCGTRRAAGQQSSAKLSTAGCPAPEMIAQCIAEPDRNWRYGSSQ